MFLKLLKKLIQPRSKPVFKLPAPSRMEARDIEKAFVRTFTTEEGQKVLSYLNGQTFMRAAAQDAPDSVLRYLEGQRALLALVIRMIERGQAISKNN